MSQYLLFGTFDCALMPWQSQGIEENIQNYQK